MDVKSAESGPAQSVVAGPGLGPVADAQAVEPTFVQLFREQASPIWVFLRRLGVREADVEDVCQEVFLIVHRKWDEFRGESSRRRWLYAIATRVASNYRRRARLRYEVAETQERPGDVVPAPDEALTRSRARARLHALLDELSDERREVFVLYELQELTMKEVVAIVDVPLQTGYSRLHAARKQVEAALARVRDEGGAV